MPAVGAYLREIRERQGISIDEIARSTRVLHHYLEALESDDLASLPAPVFAKGFIRAYCQTLGIPADEPIRLYEQRASQIHPKVTDRVGERASQRAPERPAERITERVIIAPAPAPPPPPPRPSLLPPPTPAQQAQVAAVEQRDSKSRGAVLISFVLLVVMGAALYAVTITLQSGRDDANATATPVAVTAQAPPPEPASTEPAEAPQQPVAAQRPVAAQQPAAAQPPKPQPQPASPAVAPTVSAAAVAPPTPSSVTPASPSAASPYRLVARTTETTWIRVRTEDGRTTEETIPPNEVREWVSNGPFVLTIGNAGGVSLELNGRPVPRLGASGAVISRLVLPPDVQ
jgi:cytoskeleton protein RodZ